MTLRRRFGVLFVSGFAAGVVSELVPFSLRESRCLGLLMLAGAWWILEPFPAYVTSLALVPLAVMSGVMHPVSTEAGAKLAAASFFDPVMFMFIAGFSIARAFEKFKLTTRVSRPLVNVLIVQYSKHDFSFHLTISLFCLFVSAIISNVAGAVLVTSMGRVVARELNLPRPAHARLMMTIAFASNVGGMVVPIASPQNVVAIAALRQASEGVVGVSFLGWINFALPFCLIALLVVYGVLRVRFGRVGGGYTKPAQEDGYDEESEEFVPPTLTWAQIATLTLITFTVGGWCLFDFLSLNRLFGNLGIFGLFSVVIFHASGLLGAADWQGLPWQVLALLGGGLVLGTAVEVSGLLALVASGFEDALDGSSVWVFATIFFAIIALIANFFSSTVCALIVLPIVAKVGLALDRPELFVVGAALMTSGAMGLPVSSFPNAHAAGLSDCDQPLLSTRDFVFTGFPIAGLLLAVLVTAGYMWASVIGW